MAEGPPRGSAMGWAAPLVTTDVLGCDRGTLSSPRGVLVALPGSISKIRRLSGESGEIGLRAAENWGDRATSATAGDADWREALKASEPWDSLRLWDVGLGGNRAYLVVRSARGWGSGKGATHDEEACR